MTKFDLFKKNYDDAIEAINSFLEGPESMTELVKWLMTTDANPHSYLDHTYASMTGSAEGMAGLLYSMHHAIEDDGDITFVKVNGEPRIVFANRFDDNFRDLVLLKQEKEMEKRRKEYNIGFEYEIEVLDIKPNEFGLIYDEYQREQVKKWFLNDAKRNNVEFAKEHYKKYNCWDESWVEEVKV